VKRHVSGVLRRPSPIHQTWSRSRLGHQTALKSTVLCPQTALKSTALCPQAAPGRRSSPCSLLQAAAAPPVLRRRSRPRLLRRSSRPPLGRAQPRQAPRPPLSRARPLLGRARPPLSRQQLQAALQAAPAVCRPLQRQPCLQPCFTGDW
jgi:hypothetical protein